MIDGQNCFYQPVKNDLRTYDTIQKTATGHGDDYKPIVSWIIPISNNIMS